jgi:hypothetical protein
MRRKSSKLSAMLASKQANLMSALHEENQSHLPQYFFLNSCNGVSVDGRFRISPFGPRQASTSILRGLLFYAKRFFLLSIEKT